MLIRKHIAIVVSSLALSVAWPLVDPFDPSKLGSADVYPIANLLEGRQAVPIDPTTPGSIDTENPSAPGTITNPWTHQTVETDVVVGPPIVYHPDDYSPPAIVTSGTYLYKGPFSGTNPGWSCGIKFTKPTPTTPNEADPFQADCLAALDKWVDDDTYKAKWQRLTQVYASCVLAWVPDGTDASYDRLGSDLKPGFEDLLLTCRTGDPARYYVSNYAYASWGGEYGTYSVYNSRYPADGPDVE